MKKFILDRITRSIYFIFFQLRVSRTTVVEGYCIQIMYQLWIMIPRMDPGSGLVITHTIDPPKSPNVYNGN